MMDEDITSISDESTDFSDKVYENRLALSEIIITAIIFGMTLNLISNFLWEIPEILESPYHIIISALSSIVTVILFWVIAKKYFGQEWMYERKFETAIYIDSQTNSVLDLDETYVPLIIAEFLVKYISDNERNEFFNSIRAIFAEEKEINLVPLSIFFGKILRFKLGYLADMLDNQQKPSLQDIMNERNNIKYYIAKTSPLSTISDFVFRDSEFEDDCGEIILNKSKGYVAEMKVSFRVVPHFTYLSETDFQRMKLHSITPFVEGTQKQKSSILMIDYHTSIKIILKTGRFAFQSFELNDLIHSVRKVVDDVIHTFDLWGYLEERMRMEHLSS